MKTVLHRSTSVGLCLASALAALFLAPTASLAQPGNTSTGSGALEFNSTGTYNTADGANALNQDYAGSFNTAVGSGAQYTNNYGSSNTAIGVNSLFYNYWGSYNTANGNAALCFTSNASYNTANGALALYTNNGWYNTANGFKALYSNYEGSSNTANGSSALYYNSSGAYNSANGFEALFHNTTGSHNIANGVNALYSNTTGSDNTADGNGSLYANLTGSGNTALGFGAGGSIYNGDNNIDIGSPGAGADSGIIRIGTPGTHTETFIAGINGVTASGGVAVYINSSGKLGTLTSSRRFKFDIKDIGAKSDKLMDLRPVMFRYKEAAEDGTHPIQYGLIAEEVAKVYPDLVQYDKQGKPFTVYYQLLTPMMLNELQRAHHQLNAQQAEFTSLKATVQLQNAEVASLRRSLLSVLVVVPGAVIIGLAGLACTTAAVRRRATILRPQTARACA